MPPRKYCPRGEKYDIIERRCVKETRKEAKNEALKRRTKTAQRVRIGKRVIESESQERALRVAGEIARKARVAAVKKRLDEEKRARELEHKRAAMRARFRAWASTLEKKWTMRQGEAGFNSYAYMKMVKAGLPNTLRHGRRRACAHGIPEHGRLPGAARHRS
jgi:hypothetical protein